MGGLPNKRRIGTWMIGLAVLTAAPGVLQAELRLRVLDQTGGTWLTNTGAEIAAVDAYSLASASGLLRPEDWASITRLSAEDPLRVAEQLGEGAWSFEQTAASELILGELNVAAAAVWQAGGEWEIGRVFGPQPPTNALESPGELTFEYHLVGDPLPSMGVVEVLHCGDLDRDRDVDASDLTTLITGWTGIVDGGSGTGAFSQGDCDGDLDVDASDLSGLILNWTGAAAATGVQGIGNHSSPAVRLVPEGQGVLPYVAGGWLVACAMRVRLRRDADTCAVRSNQVQPGNSA